jgi:hypothetical protein
MGGQTVETSLQEILVVMKLVMWNVAYGVVSFRKVDRRSRHSNQSSPYFLTRQCQNRLVEVIIIKYSSIKVCTVAYSFQFEQQIFNWVSSIQSP